MSRKIITFEKLAKKDVLEMFDKGIGLDGFVVEKSNPSQKVLSPEGDEIKFVKFAAITKGSEAFFNSDLISLIQLSKKISN